MDHPQIVKVLSRYIDENILGSPEPQVEATTPLLELGILTSLTLSELITFVRERLGVFIPPDQIVGANFKTLEAIADLIVGLRDSTAPHHYDEDAA